MITHALTFTGRMVDPLNLSVADVCAEDVAHALAYVNRFGGHAKRAYSVAQHSLACSRLAGLLDLPVFVQLAALLHDAAEAYLGDMIAPIKGRDGFQRYRAIESVALRKIWHALGAPVDLMVHASASIEPLDLLVLNAERHALLPSHPDWNPERNEVADSVVSSVLALTPEDAELLFLTRLRHLLGRL